MRILVLIAFFPCFFRIYDCQEGSSARSVNLALETVLEFDNNDKSADLKIIDKVRGFLDRVKDIIDNNNENRRHINTDKGENRAIKRASNHDGNHAGAHPRYRARNHAGKHANNQLTFTDFAQKVVILLNTYSDEDLEDVVAILEDEMTKYHYKGCLFYELVENYDVRRYVKDKLYQMRTNSAKNIRLQLDELTQRLANKNRGLKNKLITAYLDSLYKREDSAKLLDFLDKLAKYKRRPKRLDLVTIIRNGLRSIVFDHYSHMDHSTRRDFKVKLESFWKNRLSSELHRNILRIGTASATRGRHIAAKKKVVDSTSCSNERSTRLMMQEAQSKKRKSKRIILKNNVKKDESRWKHFTMTSTKRSTKSFITLYPESMSYERRNKWHKPRKFPRKERQKKTYDPIEEENKLFTVRRAKKFTDSKAGSMSANKHVDDTPKFTRIVYPMDEYEKDRLPGRKVRFNVVKRLFTTEATTKRIRMKQNEDDARRFQEGLTDQKTAETSEGLDIETFSSGSGSEPEHIQSRKNNDNDTFIVPLDNIKTTENTNETKTANNTEFYVKRINDLEKELRIVKEKIVNTEKNDSDSKEIPRYDLLQFWEGTPNYTDNVRRTTSKATTTTTQTPADTEVTILNTTVETTEDTPTTETTVESITIVAPTNEPFNISEMEPPGWAIDASKKDSDILPTETTVPADNIETTEEPTQLVSTYGHIINNLMPSRKDIPNIANDTYDTLDSEANEIKDAIHDLQIETLVEDPKHDEKTKSEKIQQKMMEDVKKIISDENEDKTTTPFHVSTINLDADPLSIMDDGGDII